MKMPHCRKIFAATIAIAGLVLSPAAYADDEGEWGDDPGDEWGTPEYCDKHGHSWEFDVTDPPSCESAGFDLYYCSCCGEYDQRNFVAPTGHNYNQNGICVNCNQPREGVIVYTHHPAVAPTCVWRGNIEYWSGSDGQYYDSEGGNTLAEDQVWIPALDHAWTAWTTNTPPTCTTMGRVTRSCTRADCNATETQSISALGHAWTAWATNTPPSCTVAGEGTHSCTRCSETETQEIPALGHDYSAWTTNVLPTCTSPGSEGSLCTRCGMGETQAIPALGHDWTAWTVVTPATYTALGEEAHDCSRCNAHETRALAVLQHSSFSVGGSGNTFTVVRTGEGTNLAETVYYRAVSLSAYAGQNFTSKSGSFTFAPGQIVTNVTVSTRTPSNNAYKFQSGTTRAYRFELLDEGGFRLDGRDRTITAGTSVSTNGAFNIKNVTIQAAEYTADDDGYDKNGYKSVSSNAYFSAAAPKAYFQHVGAQLRMTLSMQAKENDDAYEYLQLLFDNTSTCDNRSGASNGDPGTPNLSSYMAGFEMDTGSKDSTYRNYTFPVTNVANNAGAANPWGYSSEGKYPLSKQKFNTTTSSRATDGRIVVPLNFSSIVLRLNASGSSGSDEWAAKNVKAHVQAVDSAVPTLLGATVSPGPYHRGNTVTVSLAFSEIVVTKPSSGFFLRTSWGLLGYEGGTCGNVLTFSGKIDDGTTDSTPLSVTGFSGLTSIKDLAGNAFGGSVSRSLDASVAPSVDYAIAYDLAGGALPPNEDPNPDVYNYDSDIITLTNPVRPGYTFAGWSGTGFSGTRTTVNIAAHSHGDRAYTAHWTPTAYAITYANATNGVDGVVNANPTSYTIEDGTVSLAASTRTNYFFCGWYENPGFTGDPVSSFSAANLGARTFYAKWIALPSISYIDADGTERQRYLYTVLTNAADDATYGVSGAENWYVVTNDVTISGHLSFLDSFAHLILSDGATLTVTNGNGNAIDARNLTIYGQTNGTGAVVVNGSNSGIFSNSASVTINGGSVTATGDGYGIQALGSVTIHSGNVTANGGARGIYALGSVTISSGNVTANGTGEYGVGVGIQCLNGSVTINSGNVTANGDRYGIDAYNITLGWTNPTDSIYASGYHAESYFLLEKQFTDGIGGIYHGRINSPDFAGKTLRPFVTTPTYPAYLAEADNNVTDNYDAWAARYGYDALGVNETAFLLDVAPGAVTNGVTPLKIAELGSTNVLVAGSVYENMMWEYRIDYDEDYLPCRRIVLESGVGALKPGPWREYSGTPSSFDICNGYVVLRFTHDLSLPKSEWWAISWFVDFEGDRAVVLVPTMFKEHIRMVIEQQLNRPVSGLFLSVGIEPCTVIDPDTILTFFPMPPLVE